MHHSLLTKITFYLIAGNERDQGFFKKSQGLVSSDIKKMEVKMRRFFLYMSQLKELTACSKYLC